MATLKGSVGNYSREQILSQIARGSRYYDEEMAKSTQYGDNYIALLASLETNDIADYSAFNTDIYKSLTDPESRVEYLMNEYNKNVLSTEEYTKNSNYFKLLSMQNEADAMYNSLSDLDKILSHTGAFLMDFIHGATIGMIDDMADAGAMIIGTIQEMSGAEPGTAQKMVEESDVFGLETEIRKDLDEYRSMFTVGGRNYVTGELRNNFWGQALQGVAETLSKISVVALTKNTLGALGLGAKLTKWISTGVYYTSIFGASAEEGAENALVDPNALQLLVYSGANTALEALSESIGGWTPGGKTITNFTSRVTNTFARWGIGAATEGFEEMFSETLGFLIPLAINGVSSEEVFGVEYPTLESVLTAGAIGAIAGGVIGGVQMVNTPNGTIKVNNSEYKLTKGQSQVLQEAIDSSIEMSERNGVEALKLKTGIIDDTKLQQAFPKEYKKAVEVDAKNEVKAKKVALQLAALMNVVGEKTFAEGLKIYDGAVKKASDNINKFYEAVSINGGNSINQQLKGAVNEYKSTFGDDNNITLDTQRDTKLKEGIAAMIQAATGRKVVFVKDYVQKEGKPLNSGIAMTDNYVFIDTNHYIGSSSKISTLKMLQETIAKDVTDTVYKYLNKNAKRVLSFLLKDKKYKTKAAAKKGLDNAQAITKNQLKAYINIVMSNAIENDKLFATNKKAFKHIAAALNNTLKYAVKESKKSKYDEEKIALLYTAILLFKKTMINNISNEADAHLADTMMNEINESNDGKEDPKVEFTEAEKRTIRTNIDNKKGTTFGNIGTFALDSTEESNNYKIMVTDLESFAKDPTKLNVNGKLSLAVVLDPTTYTNEFIKQVMSYHPDAGNSDFYSAMIYYLADVYHIVLNTQLNTVFAITGLDGTNLKPEFVAKYFNPDLSGEEFAKMLMEHPVTLGDIYTDEFFDALPFTKERIAEIKKYKVVTKVDKKNKINDKKYLAVTDDKSITFDYAALSRYKMEDIQNAFFHEMVHILNNHSGFIGSAPTILRKNLKRNLKKPGMQGMNFLRDLQKFAEMCGRDITEFKNTTELINFVADQIYANTIGEMLANDRSYDAGSVIEDGFLYKVENGQAKLVGVGDFSFLSIDLNIDQESIDRITNSTNTEETIEEDSDEQSKLVSEIQDTSELETTKTKTVYEYDKRAQKYRDADWESVKDTPFYEKIKKGLKLKYSDIINAFDEAFKEGDTNALNMLMDIMNINEVSLDMKPVSKLLSAVGLHVNIGDILNDAESFDEFLEYYSYIHILNRLIYENSIHNTESEFYSSTIENFIKSFGNDASIFSENFVNKLIKNKVIITGIKKFMSSKVAKSYSNEFEQLKLNLEESQHDGIHSIYKSLLNNVLKYESNLSLAYAKFTMAMFKKTKGLIKEKTLLAHQNSGRTQESVNIDNSSIVERAAVEKNSYTQDPAKNTQSDIDDFKNFLLQNYKNFDKLDIEQIETDNPDDVEFAKIVKGLRSINDKSLSKTQKIALLSDNLRAIINITGSNSQEIDTILSYIYRVKNLTLDKFLRKLADIGLIDHRAMKYFNSIKNENFTKSEQGTFYKYENAIKSIEDSMLNDDGQVDAYSKLYYEVSENRRASLNTEEMSKLKAELKEKGAENLKLLSRQALEYASVLSVNDPDSDIALKLNEALGIDIASGSLKPTIPMNQRSATDLRKAVDEYRNLKQKVVDEAMNEETTKTVNKKISKAVRAKAEIENMREAPTTVKGIVSELLKQKNVRTSVHTNAGADENYIDSNYTIDSYEDYVALNESVLAQITPDNVEEIIAKLKKRINQGMAKNSALGIMALTAIYNRGKELGVSNSVLMPILSIQSMAGKILALSKMIEKRENKHYYNVAKFKEKILNKYDIDINFTDAEVIDFANMVKEFGEADVKNFIELGNASAKIMYDCMKSLGVSTIAEMEDLILGDIGYDKLKTNLSFVQIDRILNTYVAAKRILVESSTLRKYENKVQSKNATEDDQYTYNKAKDSLFDAYYDFAVATENTDAQEQLGNAITTTTIEKIENAAKSKGKKIDWKLFGKKLSNFRYTAMLSSPSTAVKNALTNLGLKGVHKITHFVQEKIYNKLQIKYSGLTNQSKVTYRGSIDSEITEYVNNNKLLDDLAKGTKMINVDTAGYEDHSSSVDRDAKNFKCLKKWRDTIEWALDDSRFTLPAVRKYLSEILMANKTAVREAFLKQVGAEIRQKYKDPGERNKAIKIETENSKSMKYVLDNINDESLYPYIKTATDMALNEYLRDNSKLYKTIRTALYSSNSFFSVAGRTLLSAVDPFCRVSANILTMAFEFSPGGYICAALTKKNIDAAIKAGCEATLSQFELNKLSKQMARATVGTVMMIFGMFLSAIGFIDYDEEDYMGYTVKFNLGDGATIKLKLSDLSPAITPVLLGAALQTTTKENGEKLSVIEYIGNVGGTLYESSLLGTIDNLIQYNTSLEEIGANILTSYISQYIPTVIYAVAKTVNPSKIRKSSDDGLRFLQNCFYKANFGLNIFPGFFNYKVDPYSGVMTNGLTGGNGWYNIFNFINMFSPIKIGYNGAPTDIEKAYEEVGAKSTVPTGSFTLEYTTTKDGKFVTESKKYSIDSLDRYTFELVKANYVMQTAGDLINSSAYQNMTADEKRIALNRISEDGFELAKRTYFISEGNDFYESNSNYYNKFKEYLDKKLYKYKR